MKLITFEKAHKFLDTLNIPRLDKYDSNVVIDRIDFTEQENEGNIEWRDDGVYLKINGNFQRGFMYIKHPDIERYGLPKFHLLECKTILQQKRNNRFHNHYFWSNSPTVTLTDRATRESVENATLSLCRNCQTLIKERTDEIIRDTNDFHNLLDLNDDKIENNEIENEIDIFNRPINWRRISRAYREEQKYTCEECGFGGDDLESNYDRRFIHVHHINSNELLNTHRNNLKAVCVLCHYKQDEHHQSKFEKRRMKRELMNFVRKYRNRLIEIGNLYIEEFIIENEI